MFRGFGSCLSCISEISVSLMHGRRPFPPRHQSFVSTSLPGAWKAGGVEQGGVEGRAWNTVTWNTGTSSTAHSGRQRRGSLVFLTWQTWIGTTGQHTLTVYEDHMRGGIIRSGIWKIIKSRGTAGCETALFAGSIYFPSPPEKLGMFNYRPHCLSIIFNGDVGTWKSISNVRIKFIAVRLVVYSLC